jgi:ATP-binding cassette subfamily B protein
MILRRLSRLLGDDERARVPAFVSTAIAASVLQGAGFTLVAPFLDALLRGATKEAAGWLGALVATVVASWIATHRTTMAGFELALAVLGRVRTRVGDHLVGLPLGWFTPIHTARLGALISQGVMSLLALPAHQLLPLIRAFVVPTVMIAGMAMMDSSLALAAAVALPLVGLTYYWAGRLGQAADRAVHRATEEAGQRIVEFARVQAVLRAFGVTMKGYGALEASLNQQSRAARRQIWVVVPPLLANSWLIQLSFPVLLALTAHLALNADEPLQIPVLVALLVLINRVLEPLGDVAAAGAGIRMASAELAKIEEILAEPALRFPARTVAAPEHADITFDGVRFGYAPDRTMLEGLDFSLPANTTTALIGPSGAGKSSILYLVARFFDVQAGSVRIGGIDVRQMTPISLSSLVAPVFQDTHLFSGTIRDNVMMARPNAGEDQLRRAASLSGLDEVLERLPGGWLCAVGEGGFGLSGGERQRVCIARALLKDSPILLLDEPTSALDAENAATIGRLLATLRGRKTILVVTHQIDWLAAADHLLLLRSGQLEWKGRYADFVAFGAR